MRVKKALILLNMGGVDEQNPVELFLTNMFNDKNIITVKSDFLRSLIAKFIVFMSKKNVQSHYDEIGGSSPIYAHTKAVVEKLQSKIPDVHVLYCMRYTNPFADEIVKQLKSLGTEELFLLPLYPHYSTTTVKSSLEEFDKYKNVFKIKKIKRFYTNEFYTNALVKKIKEALNNEDASSFNLVFSAHSLPQSIIDAGDSYQSEVLEHSKIIENELKKVGLEFKSYSNAYQSKIGTQKWLEPNLSEHLKEYANEKVLILPISFTIDNSETVFELSIEYKEVADEIGICDYRVVECVNSDDEFIKMLIDIYTRG